MDRLVQEVVPVIQCVQNRFPGDPPGDVRKLHLLDARNIGGAQPQVVSSSGATPDQPPQWSRILALISYLGNRATRMRRDCLSVWPGRLPSDLQS